MLIGIVGLKGSGKSTAARILSYLYYNVKDKDSTSNYEYLRCSVYLNECVEGFLHLDESCDHSDCTSFAFADKLKYTNYKIFAFSDKLKDFVASIFSIPRSYLDDREYKEDFWYNPCSGDFVRLSKTPKASKLITLKRAIVDVNCGRFGTTLNNLRNRKDYYIKLRTLLQVIGTEICQSSLGSYVWIHPTIKDAINSGEFAIIEDVRFKAELEAIKNCTEYGNLTIKLVNSKYNKADNHSSELEVNSLPCDYRIEYDGDTRKLFDSLLEIYRKLEHV